MSFRRGQMSALRGLLGVREGRTVWAPTVKCMDDNLGVGLPFRVLSSSRGQQVAAGGLDIGDITELLVV